MNLSIAVSRPNLKISPEEVQQQLAEDDFTCAFCGLQSESFQTAVVLETGKKNHPVQSVTVDPFCKAALEIDTLGGLGALIYLPNVEQEDLNNMLRAVFYAYFYGDSKAEKKEAKNFLKELFKLALPVKDKLGSADPGKLGRVFKSLPPELYFLRENIMPGLRLIYKPSVVEKRFSVDTLKDWFKDNNLSSVNAWKLLFDGLFGKRVQE